MIPLKNDDCEKFPSVFVSNFFSYLRKKGITQKKYASDNNIDATILSKWKNGDSSPTAEQVIEAAKYFKLTVNDLLYSEKEKKKLEILGDKSYDPIIAQQTINVKLFDNFFQKPFKVFGICFVIFIFLFIVVLLLVRGISSYYSLILLIGIPFVSKIIESSAFREKTYIINYLDDMFYQRKDSVFKLYPLSMTIRIVSVLLVFYYSSLFSYFDSSNTDKTALFITLLLILLVLIATSFSSFFSLPRKFKLKIYDNEIDAINLSKFLLIVHFALFFTSILFCILNFLLFYLFGIVALIILCINAVDYVVLSKEYAKYVLMYRENDKEPRVLFSTKN